MILKFFIIIFFPFALIAQTKTNIDEIINTAMENNQSIKSARLKIEKEDAINLRSFNLPKPELFIEYEGVKGSLNNSESRKIGITQELEFPSVYFLRSDVQHSQIQVAREELNKVMNDLKAEIKLNYYQLLLLYGLLEISKENLRIYETFLFTAEKKYEAGATSNLEVLGAKVNKIKFEIEISNLESKIKIIQSEIRNISGITTSDIYPSDVQPIREIGLSKPELMQKTLNNNPDLRILKFQKERSSNKISLSKGEILPDIKFSYFKQKLGTDNGYWGMEVGLGIPLWFWWEQSGKVKEADFELQISSSEELNLKRSLENEINSSFEDYENSLRQMKFYKEDVFKETSEILRQAKMSYEEGAIGYVEYLQALNIAYEANTQYLNSVFNYNKSVITLEKLTGGELK